MVDGVLAQREPTASGFERVRYAIFLVSGEVLPGVVASHGKEVPGAALQMLHQYQAGDGVSRTWRLTECFFQLVAMSGSRPSHGDYIDRACSLGRLVAEAHGANELWPRRAVDKGIGVPEVQIAHGCGYRGAGGVHCGLGSEMLDGYVVPVLAILVAQDKAVLRHGRARCRCLEEIAFLNGFAECGLGEVDVVDVGASRGCRGRILRRGDGKEQKQGEN